MGVLLVITLSSSQVSQGDMALEVKEFEQKEQASEDVLGTGGV